MRKNYSSDKDLVNKGNVLTDGLMICLDKLSKMRNYNDIEEYLSFGDDEFSDVKEEVARLLLVATTMPSSQSPTVDISEKLMEKHIVDINSVFLKEVLEIAHRNKNNSFMNSSLFKKINRNVENIEFNYNNYEFNLNDGIVLIKNIRNLYIANIDQNIENNKLDIRYREPLIDLFQYNLDYTLDKIKNGVRENVQVQTRHQ